MIAIIGGAKVSTKIDLLENLVSKVDALVNNAGYGLRGPLHIQDPEDQTAMLQVMVGSLTALARGVVPGMRARGPSRMGF
mgnify:CR=1 FL=1